MFRIGMRIAFGIILLIFGLVLISEDETWNLISINPLLILAGLYLLITGIIKVIRQIKNQ